MECPIKKMKQGTENTKTPKDKVIDASVRGKKPAAAEHRYYQNRKRQQAAKKVAPVKIAFLGGLNEVGKNITLYEYGNDMFLVDCGLAFPDQDMPGVDLVLPDFYLSGAQCR